MERQKIKQLEDKIEELELDKTDLETKLDSKLNSVEAELTTVRKQVTKLKDGEQVQSRTKCYIGRKLRKNVEESGGNGFGYGEN